MDGKIKDNKYLIIHTHFYQPPRENPYTGEIEIDYTSKPYDNWNHRIAMESYFPNLYARIYDNQSEIIEIINNCEYFNLDFGPTILSWIEKKYPYYYQKITGTFNKTKNSCFNFMAQAYNHTILPLDSFLDKIVQINWGIKDFEFRFGSKPYGMWLGECAVNEDVLKLLIDSSIKYIILSPHQILKAFDPDTKKEIPVLPNKIYRWYDRTDGSYIQSRFIDIIAYDDILSKKVAFNNITFNSEIFSKELKHRYLETNSDILVIACDGETFGHHQKFADLTLAHTFRHELSKREIMVISAYQYLKKSQVYAICQLNPGPDGQGTSWSCEHGIRRWSGGCPCGDEGKYSTEWRRGLRAAVNWLSEVVNDIFEEEGKKLFKDNLASIIEYIDLINGKISDEEFFSKHLKENTKGNKERALKILEMFRYKSLSRISCGWFFNDISRIESQLIMKNAMKASEITDELGYRGIEKGFISLLELAPSNFSEFKNGRGVYEKLVKKSKMDDKKTAVYLTLKSLFRNEYAYQNSIWSIDIKKCNTQGFVCGVSSEIKKRDGSLFNLKINLDLSSLERIKISAEINGISDIFSIYDFNTPAQLELLKLILTEIKQKEIEEIENKLNSFIEIAQIYPLMVEENLYEDISYHFKSFINSSIIRFIKRHDLSVIDKIEGILEKLNKLNFKIDFEPSNDLLILMPEFAKMIFEKKLQEDDIIKIDRVFKKLSLPHFYFHTKNYLYDLKQKN
ncbi:MAG: DUF3536 domain-containing protein [Elusimicrobiales bacterium]